MTRVMLAWEGGAGRGHISTLRSIAMALDGIAVCDAAVNNMRYANELSPHCDLAFPGSAFRIDKRRRMQGGNEPICSWADHLGDLGFGDPDFLSARLAWWIEALRARASSVVVADFAPVATLAAQVLGLGSVIIGTGYLAPPPGLDRFPVLVPALSISHYEEGHLLATVNAVLGQHGAAPLARLADIYRCHVFLPQTITALDPYAGQRDTPYLPPLEVGMPVAGDGDEIFGYFSTDEVRDEVLMEALRQLGPKLRLHMPALSVDQAASLAAAGVKVEREPMPMAAIAARSRLCINAGQHGTLCMAMAMGLPQVAIPRHLEHSYHACKGRDLGCVDVVSRFERDPAAITARILAAYHDGGRRETARQVASDLRHQLTGPVRDIIRLRFSPLLT